MAGRLPVDIITSAQIKDFIVLLCTDNSVMRIPNHIVVSRVVWQDERVWSDIAAQRYNAIVDFLSHCIINYSPRNCLVISIPLEGKTAS